jgi:hypothetical protein
LLEFFVFGEFVSANGFDGYGFEFGEHASLVDFAELPLADQLAQLVLALSSPDSAIWLFHLNLTG